MNKNFTKLMIVIFCFSAFAAFAQQKEQQIIKTPDLKIKNIIRPDLVFSKAWVKEDTCRLWVEYQNIGDGDIGMTILREKIKVNGVVVEDATYTQPMPAGTYFSHGVQANPGYIVSGTVNVSVELDVDNALVEVNERNNFGSATVSCRKKPGVVITKTPKIVKPLNILRLPDLYPRKSIKIGNKVAYPHTITTLTPADAIDYDNKSASFNFYYAMINKKNSAGAKNFDNRIYFDNILISKQTELEIGKGPDTKNIHTQGYLKLEDNKVLKLVLDAGGNVKEADETNNSVSFRIKFSGFRKKAVNRPKK